MVIPITGFPRPTLVASNEVVGYLLVASNRVVGQLLQQVVHVVVVDLYVGDKHGVLVVIINTGQDGRVTDPLLVSKVTSVNTKQWQNYLEVKYGNQNSRIRMAWPPRDLVKISCDFECSQSVLLPRPCRVSQHNPSSTAVNILGCFFQLPFDKWCLWS